MTAFANPSSGGPDPFGLTLWDQVYNENPQAGYQRWLQQSGQGGNQSAYEQWLQQQGGRAYNAYVGSAPEHGLDYSFLDYLRDNGSTLEQQFRGLAPRQRGEQYAYGTGRTRYIL